MQNNMVGGKAKHTQPPRKFTTSTKLRHRVAGACAGREWLSWLHVVLALLFVKLSLLLRGGILVLLVLRDEIIHVALRLGKLHFVHALSRVPMQERLAPEHRSEVLSYAFEHLLNSGRIACEGDCHLQALRGNVADAALDVVRNPLYEVARVLVLHIQHLLVHFFRRHAPTEK